MAWSKGRKRKEYTGMTYPYKTRNGGATVTVFVPYDCGNHCPFCINKKEYANNSDFSEAKILNSIRIMDQITPYCDFVFTGGEPLANLQSLQRMLDALSTTHRIFINTTLPVQAAVSETDILFFLKRNQKKITCVNISRHLAKYVEECSDELLRRLPCAFRINCVLYKDYPTRKVLEFVKRFSSFPTSIQFRSDYTMTTPENLYEEDQIFHNLKELFRYIGLEGCRMRNGYHFSYLGFPITYHKTLPYSTIVETDTSGTTYEILYDVVIKQNGEIHSDWTGVPLNISAYRNVRFEPYDLQSLPLENEGLSLNKLKGT